LARRAFLRLFSRLPRSTSSTQLALTFSKVFFTYHIHTTSTSSYTMATLAVVDPIGVSQIKLDKLADKAKKGHGTAGPSLRWFVTHRVKELKVCLSSSETIANAKHHSLTPGKTCPSKFYSQLGAMRSQVCCLTTEFVCSSTMTSRAMMTKLRALVLRVEFRWLVPGSLFRHRERITDPTSLRHKMATEFLRLRR
jgi:hypothetical protein